MLSSFPETAGGVAEGDDVAKGDMPFSREVGLAIGGGAAAGAGEEDGERSVSSSGKQAMLLTDEFEVDDPIAVELEFGIMLAPMEA